MRLIIQPDYDKLSKWAASYIASKINSNVSEEPFVLGLPTGSSPLGTYKELIKLYQQKKVSFNNVVTFNMDEYIGIPQNHPQSYYTFMWDNFFNHIDIVKDNVNILNGNAPDKTIECEQYEQKIASYD